ncbi:hypothetical protein KI387_003408, partial [Taxus chinensis]
VNGTAQPYLSPRAMNRAMESASAERTEPPNIITFKTRSETDILDDGYRWKKYGQKRIKNNPYQ